jgi:cystathionine gamma-synthase
MSQEKEPSQSTLCVWGGEGQPEAINSTQVPIVLSAAYQYPDIDSWLDVAQGRIDGHIYSRNSNPTVKAFEEKVRCLEGAEAATSFATGMAAISNTFFAILAPGDRVVSIRDTYGGTSKLFLEFLPRFGIEVEMLDTTDHQGIKRATQKGCRLLYLESPTNPTLKILDIATLSDTAHRNNTIVMVDNTFATPINQNPLQLGADLVVHSATKFLGGHADALGGVLCGSADLVARVFHFREINGSSLDASSAYMLLRGMKTLHLRVNHQNETALAIAQFLAKHPKVEAVYYPGLPTHEGHSTAKSQMRGFGGIVGFSLVSGFSGVKELLPKLQHAHLAANLGSVETIVGPPATTSHVECTEKEMEELGIPKGLIRYSVGIEDQEDLIEDLRQALDRI